MDETVTLWQIVQVIFIPIIGVMFLFIRNNAKNIREIEKNIDQWKLHTVKNHPTKRDLNEFTAELKTEFKNMQGDIKTLYGEIRNLFIEIKQHNLDYSRPKDIRK